MTSFCSRRTSIGPHFGSSYALKVGIAEEVKNGFGVGGREKQPEAFVVALAGKPLHVRHLTTVDNCGHKSKERVEMCGHSASSLVLRRTVSTGVDLAHGHVYVGTTRCGRAWCVKHLPNRIDSRRRSHTLKWSKVVLSALDSVLTDILSAAIPH